MKTDAELKAAWHEVWFQDALRMSRAAEAVMTDHGIDAAALDWMLDHAKAEGWPNA